MKGNDNDMDANKIDMEKLFAKIEEKLSKREDFELNSSLEGVKYNIKVLAPNRK